VGHLARMAAMRNAYNILVRISRVRATSTRRLEGKRNRVCWFGLYSSALG